MAKFFENASTGRIDFRCRHYRAARPCTPNVELGVECPTCPIGSRFDQRILVIKLASLGDVVRTSAILPILLNRHPKARVTWLTLPNAVDLVQLFEGVDEILPLDAAAIARLATGNWSHVYSLSNDPESAALATFSARGAPITGYWLEEGTLRSGNAAGVRWLELAAFNRLKRENTLHWSDHMAAILDHSGALGRPVLRLPPLVSKRVKTRLRTCTSGSSRARLGINIGGGPRWPKKMLSAGGIAALTELLLTMCDADLFFLSGPNEVAKAAQVATLTTGLPRLFDVATTGSTVEFAAMIAHMDAIVCGDTLALHLATAFDVPAVALFGPTSAAEISSWDGRVAKVWVRDMACRPCYGDCDQADNCMSMINLEKVASLAVRALHSQVASRKPDVIDPLGN